MNSHNSLEIILRDILQVVNPTHDDWTKRFQVISDLRAVIDTLDILRDATLEPFGSFVSNLFTRWGDLDISIELPNGSYISSAGKKHKQTLLLDVLKALKRKGGFHGIKYISHARVPILKCDSNKENISCDISINNLSGQMKSKLLFWINDIDRRFRDMVLIVKEWAKAHDINDSKTGTLNSYSLSLLIVFHFQTCEPAILPPLSEIYPGNMAADLKGVRAVAEKNIEEICSANIKRIKLERSRNINGSSLADLFISFLAKFSDISLRAATQGISPHNGQWEDIDTNMIWQPKTYALFIEDPFEQPMNCARAIGQRNLNKIANAFRSSHQKLTSPNQNYPLAVLVRPEVLSIMSRSQVLSSGGPSVNPIRTNPHVHINPNGNVRGSSGAHLQSYGNTSNSYNQNQHRNGGSQVFNGAHTPTQVQHRNMQVNSTYNRVNQMHFQGSQSQIEPSQSVVVNQRPPNKVTIRPPDNVVNQRPSNKVTIRPPDNGANQRPANNGVNQRPGPSSQNQQRWIPRS
ncbi:protein HESO1 [Rutidosis leptorrhynchoides]|uniref:protein HESO1 n=1 Tax=Rutidosis leptorrhynchoides TaxID=125765 RepID=UPI003A991420